MKATLALAAVAGLTTMASAGPVIWDNGAPSATAGLYSSQLDTCYPFDSQVADDFMFEVDQEVWDVHWWGGFWGGTPPWPNPIDFNIYFYLTDPFSGYPEVIDPSTPNPIIQKRVCHIGTTRPVTIMYAGMLAMRGAVI